MLKKGKNIIKMNNLSSDLNVIMIGRFPYPKGMAGTMRVRYFAEYLCDCGVNTRIISIIQTSKSKKNGNYNGVDYESIGDDISSCRLNVFKYMKYYCDGLSRLVRYKDIKKKNIVYIYGPPQFDNIVMVLISKLLGYKIVFDIVEDYRHEESQRTITRIKNIFILFLEKRIRLFADGLVVISKHLYSKFSDLIDESKMKDITISSEIKDILITDEDNIIKIVYSGSFGKKDGLFNLIEAFELISAEEVRAELLLAGKGSAADISTLTRFIEGKSKIRYVGYLDENDFYDFLGSADILCSTRIDSDFSRAGFPFKLATYLATGKPVVVSDIGDTQCYLEDKKDAMLVRPGSVEDIKSAIDYLIRNPRKASLIGMSGREKCSIYFNPVTNGRLLLELLWAI